MKQIQQFFSLETSYDSKHILNTCNKKVPQEILDQVEQGVTIEQLESLMNQNFDVFKYKTQITIHGLFDELSTRRIGGYVNLTQNKNLSIGVRYTAIDYEKKAKLYGLLHDVDAWGIERNSQAFSICKMERLPRLSAWNPTEDEKQEYFSKCKELVAKFRDQAQRINRSLFVGHVDCYLAEDFFGKYVVLDVNILCFYEKNLQAIFENISGKTFAEGLAIAEQKRKEKEEKSRLLHEEMEQKRKEYEKKDAENKANFLATNILPQTFTKVEKFEPQIGDIYAISTKDYSGDYHWNFFVITKHAGRILSKPCDIDGNIEKYAKGTVQKREIRAEYLKREFSVADMPKAKLFIQNLTPNSFLLTGNTYPIRQRIKSLGGTWNKWRKGWFFSKNAEEKVRKEFSIA